MLRAITSSPINILLLAAPISWALAATSPESPWVFITAAASLVPLAGLIGLGTEQLARRSGPALGGFLNATFGNAAELIIAVVALRNGHIELVKASITGSIIGNLLLVLGLSFFVGGLGRRTQKFHRTSANNTSAMLFLGVVALVMPAVFDLSIYGNLAAHRGSRRARDRRRPASRAPRRPGRASPRCWWPKCGGTSGCGARDRRRRTRGRARAAGCR